MIDRRRSTVPVVVAFLAGCGAPAPPPAAPSPVAGLPIAVIAEEGATAAALALVVGGTGWEGERTSGLTLLAAQSLVEVAAPELVALGARADVVCGRWALIVRLLAPADAWPPAARLLAEAFERASPSPDAIARARVRLAETLALDRANPGWQADVAAGRALYGAAGGAAWTRPPCGVPESLGLFEAGEIRMAADRLRAIRSAAIVGSVGAHDPAASVVASLLTDGRTRPSFFPVPGPSAQTPVYVERNTVTAWLSVAWRFGPEADPEAVRLVGALLADAVRPTPGRPEVLHASSEVEIHGDGGALVVTVVAAPASVAALAAALEAEAARLAADLEPAAVLERVALREWGRRLRELATPEARAARAALDLARGGAGAGWPERESYTAAAVRDAARSLGLPARAVVGPRAARRAVAP